MTTPPAVSSPADPNPPAWYRSDSVAIATLLVLCVLASVLRWMHSDWMSGYDGFNDFLPDWAYMGQRLKDGEIPGWNPYYSSGTPFAGDPGTGWMYLPIMLSFALFNVLAAWKFLLLLMAVICGLATYLFARAIGLLAFPALFASSTFALGAIIYGLATDRIAVTTSYLPIVVGLLAAEKALQSRKLSAQLGWAALGGIALAHNFSAWPAQGMLYTAMYIGGWLAYRWLFAPPPGVADRREALRRCLIFGAGMSIVALTWGLSAWWTLLDVTNQSTIPGGDYSEAVNGQPVGPTEPVLDFLSVLLRDSEGFRITTAAGAVIPLALAAIASFRNRYGMPYLAVMVFLFTDLAVDESITRWFFYLIPFFEHAHAHRPTAANAFVFPALNLLAAAGIQLLFDEKSLSRYLKTMAIAVGAFCAMLAAITLADLPIGSAWPVVISGLTFVIMLGIGYSRLFAHPAGSPVSAQLLATGMLVLALIYPTLLDYGRIWNGTGRTPGLQDVQISENDVNWVVETSAQTSSPGSAAEFLQQQAANRQPFRYAAYYAADTDDYGHVPFVFRRLDPFVVMSMGAGPRSALLQLEQISGYNPVHMKYYSEYFEYMQGRQQDYHFVDVFREALDASQLFSMLNVQYVVVGTNVPFNPPIAVYGTEVYRDPLVIIYENPYAFDRAWIVHDVRPSMEDGVDIQALNDYGLDGHFVAFVDGEVPAFAPLPADAPADSVTITSYEPEEIRLRASTAADGLLVLSEVYADGWKAYVDGEEVEILRTNHALRGVPITAGDHEVVLRYELRSLEIGLWSTGLTSLGILAIWGWAAVDSRRRPAQQTRETTAIDSAADATAHQG